MARRHAARRQKQQATETSTPKITLYAFIVLSWMLFVCLDYITGLRLEYVLSCFYTTPIIADLQVHSSWTLARVVVAIVLVDTACYVILPHEVLLLLASACVWAYIIWDLAPQWLPSLSLFALFVYVEKFHRLSPSLALCRPLAAHTIGFPITVLCRDLPGCVSLWLERRRRNRVVRRNRQLYGYIREAAADENAVQPLAAARDSGDAVMAAVIGHPSEAIPAPSVQAAPLPAGKQPAAPKATDSTPQKCWDTNSLPANRKQNGAVSVATGSGPPNPTNQAQTMPHPQGGSGEFLGSARDDGEQMANGVRPGAQRGGKDLEPTQSMVFLMGCLKEERMKLKEVVGALQKAEKEVERLVGAEAALKTELCTARQNVLQLEADMEKLREQVNVSKAACRKKDDAYRQWERLLDKAHREKTKIEADLRHVTEKARQAEGMVEKLTKAKEHYERDMQREREAQAQLHARVRVLEGVRDKAGAQVKALEAKLQQATSELQAVRRQKADVAKAEKTEAEKQQQQDKATVPQATGSPPADSALVGQMESHIKVLQEKNRALQNTLAAETKFKMDLMAELSRAQREFRALKGVEGFYTR